MSVGDAHFQEKCLAKLREFQSQGLTIVVVSHSIELVEKFCEQAILIDGGHLVDEGAPRQVILRYLDLVGHLPEMVIWAAQLYLFSRYDRLFTASIPQRIGRCHCPTSSDVPYNTRLLRVDNAELG